MFEFWREATAASVPGLLCHSGRRRSENVSILSSLLTVAKNAIVKATFQLRSSHVSEKRSKATCELSRFIETR